MRLGMIGLGKMGGNRTERLLRGGHEVVAFDRSSKSLRSTLTKGAIGAAMLGPRSWVSSHHTDRLDHGACRETVDETIAEFCLGLSKGTSSSMAATPFSRYPSPREVPRAGGIDFIDAGTSGGIWG